MAYCPLIRKATFEQFPTIGNRTYWNTAQNYLEGGVSPSFHPLQPGETIQDRVGEIEDIFRQVKGLFPDLYAEVKINLDRNPFDIQGSEELWRILSHQVERVTEDTPRPVGVNAWGDATLFQEAGILTLELGARGENFHAPQEWVSLLDVVKLVEILKSTAQEYCA